MTVAIPFPTEHLRTPAPSPDLAQSDRLLLIELLDQALSAVDPLGVVPPCLPEPPAPGGRTIVIGAGKAAARMALAVERAWHGPLEGLVVTRYGYHEATTRVRVVEAGHPVPDAAGDAPPLPKLAPAPAAPARDPGVCLISRGGSALPSLPAGGVSLGRT